MVTTKTRPKSFSETITTYGSTSISFGTASDWFNFKNKDCETSTEYYTYSLVTDPDPDKITINSATGALNIPLNSEGSSRGAISKTVQVKLTFKYNSAKIFTSNAIAIKVSAAAVCAFS
jgi:hypothetical protein